MQARAQLSRPSSIGTTGEHADRHTPGRISLYAAESLVEVAMTEQLRGRNRKRLYMLLIINEHYICIVELFHINIFIHR
jgi:hypothetical protein